MALLTTFSGNDDEAFPLWTPEPDIDKLLAYEDINAAIIELDNYISQLCGWGEEMDKLTEPQKNFFYNQNLEREVNNGGFHLYFLNSAGDHAHETLDALKFIGAHKTAAILQSAMNQFPDGHVPPDRSDREALVKQLGDAARNAWNELDEQFYKYEDDLNHLNIEYVRQNKAAFGSKN